VEARALKHNYIGTEHLLLGLLREEQGLAARVLASLNVGIEDVRVQVRAIVGEGEELTTGQIPFTPRAKKVLELALREAQSLEHHYIGTEHLLLGLARENEGVAMRILLDKGVDAGRIHEEVIKHLGGRVRFPRPMHFPPPVFRRAMPPVALLAAGWLLFALALGAGILVGWAIWH